MKITAVMTVRNEQHVLATNIAHHRALGVDEFRILDNGSQDGTVEVITAMAERDPSVKWTTDDGPYRQNEMVTELAREAFRHGADWVVPIDADEFWWTPTRSLKVALDGSDAGALVCQVDNFVQSAAVLHDHPTSLVTMIYRAQASGRHEDAKRLVEEQKIGFVEITYPPKLILRPTPSLTIALGNHSATGYAGEERPATDVVVLHAPIRARDRFINRAELGRRHNVMYADSDIGWHVRRLADMNAEGLEAEWTANSYDNGALTVQGLRHPLVRDHRLRDAVLPHTARLDRWLGPFRSRRPGSSPTAVGEHRHADQ